MRIACQWGRSEGPSLGWWEKPTDDQLSQLRVFTSDCLVCPANSVGVLCSGPAVGCQPAALPAISAL